LDRIGNTLRPDIVWACSDVPHAVLGAAAARRLGAKLVIDLYDNFESYRLSRIPGINLALRRAVRSANGVTCISSPLAQLVRNKYSFQGSIEVIENAIPPGIFKRDDKAACRAQFGLPENAILIGTAGALSRTRGTECLLQAFQKLAQERADVHLVLAGALDSDLAMPTTERIRYLGLLPPNAVPRLLSALDISVVCNRDSAFGRYCFPQKLYESLACEIPVAVARVGAVADLLRDFPENLYEPENVDSLLVTLRNLCRKPVSPAVPIPTWNFLGEKLGSFLSDISKSSLPG
jgi:glycosyltransferase involved in cell wall biosynthesis